MGKGEQTHVAAVITINGFLLWMTENIKFMFYSILYNNSFCLGKVFMNVVVNGPNGLQM